MACQQATRRGLPPQMWAKTFESWEKTSEMTTAFNAVKKLLSSSPGNPLVLLTGPYGIGKTHLMYAACNKCREMRWPYKFIRTVDLMNEIKGAISESKRNPEAWPPERIIGSYQGDFLLCLDDFGKHQATEYADTSIFDIIDARYALARPTIITTNMNPERFMDGAIFSRLKPGMVHCSGKDQRERFE